MGAVSGVSQRQRTQDLLVGHYQVGYEDDYGENERYGEHHLNHWLGAFFILDSHHEKRCRNTQNETAPRRAARGRFRSGERVWMTNHPAKSV